jgi:hypothetical protein
MPPIQRLTPTHDSIKTVTPTQMVALLDAIPLERRPRIGSNARAGYLTGKFLIERDGELVGCDVFSEANYEAALAIMAKERPAPSLLPAQAEPSDLGDEVVALLRAQGWGGLAPDADVEPEAGPRDFGDDVADEYMKNFGNGKAAY